MFISSSFRIVWFMMVLATACTTIDLYPKKECTGCSARRQKKKTKKVETVTVVKVKEVKKTEPKKVIVHEPAQELPKIDVQKFCKARYENITGFGIPQEEEALITDKGGAPTYGEIEYDSLTTIMDDISWDAIENGAFYDYGSGVGKVCVQIYFCYPFKTVTGIELSDKRFNGSQKVLQDIKRLGFLDEGRTLEFIKGDFLEENTDDATVIYMCSTCYSDELMLKLTKKFSKFKKGLYVITLKELPQYEEYGFALEKDYKLPMSWSKDTGGSPVHLYKLTKKAKKKEKVAAKKGESKAAEPKKAGAST